MSPNHHPKKSMDAFQIRLDCLALVKKVNASQQAIAKVVDFALKYASIASDDVWDCIVSECAKSSLNNKLNILFLIDALLISIVDPVGYSSFSDSASSSTNVDHSTIAASHYLSLATRDLNKIVDSVVPKDDWDSVRMNATDTQKVLTSWKRLGIFKSEDLDSATNSLHARKEALAKLPSSSKTQFSKQDTLRRIEEDRERHKRLRERVWILPAKSFADAIPQRTLSQKSLSSHHRTMITNKPSSKVVKPDSINIEFEDLWENLSDLNDDDYEKMQEVDQKWWGSSSFVQKQISMESQPDEIKPLTDDKKRETSPPLNRWRKIGSNAKEREGNKRSSYDDDNVWHSRHYSDGKYRRNR